MRDDSIPCCEPEFWAYLIISLILVSIAGITSGLALGLLSFTKVDLEVLIKAGQPQAQKNAAKILPLVKNEHFLLCTLLVVKSLAMEALPIFLDTILPFWAAILMSVILVIAFGEIIPQAVCARYGLSIGAHSSALVRFLLVAFYPIAYPISKLLDWLLGKGHSALLRRAELKTLVDLHSNEAGKGGELSHHEATIISGALDMTEKTAKDAMTPISETFSLDINSKLDEYTMSLIMSKGHSRIPIYSGSPNNVIGLILVKNLIFCHPEDEVPVKNMTIRRIPRVNEDWPLYDILNQFEKGHSHMAVVVKGINLQFDQTEPPNISTSTFPLDYNHTEFHSPINKSIIEHDKDSHPQYKNGERGSGNVSAEGSVSLLSDLDDEVIGIITMEDVIEELLQEEILDETDEYVNVQNKIRINPLPLRRSASASRSPGRASFPHLLSIKQEPTPIPIVRSPMSPYIRSPLTRSMLSSSPAKHMEIL